MRKRKLLKKIVNLTLAAAIAGNIITMGPNGIAAKLSENPMLISDEVKAADAAVTNKLPQQISWSTEYVYGLFPIDVSTGGQSGAADGSEVSMDYAAGIDKNWRFHITTAITTDGQVLQYQYLSPKSFLNRCGAHNGYYGYSDVNGCYQLVVEREFLNAHAHLWEYTKDELCAELSGGGVSDMGAACYEAVEDETFYKVMANLNMVFGDGAMFTGFYSIIEVKATGEVYGFMYGETPALYDDLRAREIIYSCLPTKLQ
ncbi:MAG: hypothetical protein J6D08_04465 [Lachnospiraceae bacterium]|nr:hypothetical protein [Lachnospiraceae bacterium]